MTQNQLKQFKFLLSQSAPKNPNKCKKKSKIFKEEEESHFQ